MTGIKRIIFTISSLIHVTEIKAKQCLLAIPVGYVDLNDPTASNKIYQVCKLASLYNTQRGYQNTICNCHTFCDEALKELGFNLDEIKFPGQLGDYLKKLKTNLLEKEFIDPTTQKKHIFASHKDLDKFAQDLFKRVPMQEFAKKYEGDFVLLKAFDRYECCSGV